VTGIAFALIALLYLVVPALLLLLLYWIIRKAVAAGIRDAQNEPVKLRSRI
jgi:hypothetical protein